jgi:hypothetical protein
MAAAKRTARPTTSGYVGARACLALCLVAAARRRARARRHLSISVLKMMRDAGVSALRDERRSST